MDRTAKIAELESRAAALEARITKKALTVNITNAVPMGEVVGAFLTAVINEVPLYWGFDRTRTSVRTEYDSTGVVAIRFSEATPETQEQSLEGVDAAGFLRVGINWSTKTLFAWYDSPVEGFDSKDLLKVPLSKAVALSPSRLAAFISSKMR